MTFFGWLALIKSVMFIAVVLTRLAAGESLDGYPLLSATMTALLWAVAYAASQWGDRP